MWNRRSLPLVFLTAVLVAAGCGDEDGPTSPADPFQVIIEEFSLAPLPAIPYPPDNPFNAQRIALGQLLFFDPILGGESAPWVKVAAGVDPATHRANDMACGTCHLPQFAFADGRRLGAGVGGGQMNPMAMGPHRVVPGRSMLTGEFVGTEPRNAPSILNTAFAGAGSITPSHKGFLFLDGRAEGLEAVAKLPLTSRDEMAGDAYGIPPGMPEEEFEPIIQDSVTARIRNIPEYVERFKQAFTGEIHEPSDLTMDHIARAIAAFERELITPGSPYDNFVMGDRDALNSMEKRGFELFFGKALCGDCHSGPMLADYTFRIQGVAEDYDSIIPDFEGKNGEGGDFGRFHANPAEFADQKYAFRVLTVRNAEMTGPYFHSGSAGTLREVVEFYNRGGLGPHDISTKTLENAGVVRDASIRPLGLTDDEMDAIVAFMRTTTAPVKPGPMGLTMTEVPTRVPSGLIPPSIEGPDYPAPSTSARVGMDGPAPGR